MKIYVTLLVSALLFSEISAQSLAAYTDYKNYFFAFDNGPNIQLESQPITSYKIGGNAIAYVNGVDNFRAYYKGDSYDLLSISPARYDACDNYVVFYRDMILNVFDNGKRTLLSGNTTSYAVGDSMVAFYDLNSAYLRAYYNGQTQDIEGVYGVDPDSVKFKVGDNILAYINSANQFKIYYHERILNLESYAPTTFKVGKNIVAYLDAYTQAFKIFYSGMNYTVESNAPISFIAGDDMVAYVSNTGDFKVFYQGQLLKIASFTPSFYDVTDNVLIYFDGKYFTAFYKGKITTLETYLPTNIQKDFNTVAYIDRSGYLQALYYGKQQRISEEKVKMFELTGDVLKYNSGVSDFKFFIKGQTVLH